MHVYHESLVLSLCASDFGIVRDLESSLKEQLRNGHFEEDWDRVV